MLREGVVFDDLSYRGPEISLISIQQEVLGLIFNAILLEVLLDRIGDGLLLHDRRFLFLAFIYRFG